jgi:hypothetical protein
VSGYWAKAGVEESEYLPEPPASLDRGPSVPASAENQTYVPGIWYWTSGRYAWRPGYWVTYRPGWIWVPATYRWTPAGYVYVSGYWDLPLLERGLLFAPVRFTRRVYLAPGFVYRPAYVIQPDFLCGALFVRTGFGGYYFGDYFAAGYRSNYVSWVSYRPSRFFVDVNFGYYRVAYARYPAWERNLSTLYVSRFNGDIPRPPRTLVQQNTVINNITINRTTTNIVHKNVNITNIQNVNVLAPVSKVSNIRVTAMSSLAAPKPGAAIAAPISRDLRIEKASRERLLEERRSMDRMRALARERKAHEARILSKGPAAAPKAPVRVKIEPPKGTPPARVIRSPIKPPPPPTRPEVRPVPVPKPPTTVPMPPRTVTPPPHRTTPPATTVPPVRVTPPTTVTPPRPVVPPTPPPPPARVTPATTTPKPPPPPPSRVLPGKEKEKR